MRKTRRSHSLIRRLVFAETHVAIDTQQRSAGWSGIRDEVRTDGVKPRVKILDETQERITHEFFVAPLVLLKPFAVVVLAEVAEKLEKIRREVNPVFHGSFHRRA